VKTSIYAQDILVQVESILSGEIAKSIDSQIIKDLMGKRRIGKIRKIKDKLKQMKKNQYNNYDE
jgi:hypothetical protein